MEIDVRDAEKRVYVWLSRAESNNAELRESLKPLYQKYKAKKYLVAVFSSGTENLEDVTRDLLCFNHIRMRELEIKKEKVYDCAR